MKLEGKQPRVPNMLVKCYVRHAAAKAGILSLHRNGNGELVEDDLRRFGFHSLRHSLASFLVRTSLQLYAHSVTEDRLGRRKHSRSRRSWEVVKSWQHQPIAD